MKRIMELLFFISLGGRFLNFAISTSVFFVIIQRKSENVKPDGIEDCDKNCKSPSCVGDGRSKNGVPENEERVFGVI